MITDSAAAPATLGALRQALRHLGGDVSVQVTYRVLLATAKRA